MGKISSSSSTSSIRLGSSDFIAGNKISIGDLMAVGEIDMSRLCNYDASNGRLKIAVYSTSRSFMNHEAVGPQIYDDVHASLLKFQEMVKDKFPQ